MMLSHIESFITPNSIVYSMVDLDPNTTVGTAIRGLGSALPFGRTLTDILTMTYWGGALAHEIALPNLVDDNDGSLLSGFWASLPQRLTGYGGELAQLLALFTHDSALYAVGTVAKAASQVFNIWYNDLVLNGPDYWRFGLKPKSTRNQAQ